MPASGLKPGRSPWSWVPSLYFVEGLPNALVTAVSLVMLKDMGVENDAATLYVSLFYLPWVIKPFWSPFVDAFGTKRLWVIAMQMLMAVCVGMIALMLHSPAWLAASLAAFWMMAFASATHDIAADGFYMLALDNRTQDFFVGIRATAYRLAGLFATGAVVWGAGKFIDGGTGVADTWVIIMVTLAAMLGLLGIWHSYSLPRPETTRRTVSVHEVMKEFMQSFKTFFRKPGILTAIAFLLLYRLPEAFMDKIAVPFLKDSVEKGGMGLTDSQLGITNGIYGTAAGIVGGIIGGIIVARHGLRRCIWPMALALTLPSAFYWYLAAVQPTDFMIINLGIAVEKFGYIFGYTAMMVFMLRFNDKSEFTTSHFAFCTGIAFLGLMLPGLVAGSVQMAIGYKAAFALVMALCPATFLAVILAGKMKFVSDEKNA